MGVARLIQIAPGERFATVETLRCVKSAYAAPASQASVKSGHRSPKIASRLVKRFNTSALAGCAQARPHRRCDYARQAGARLGAASWQAVALSASLRLRAQLFSTSPADLAIAAARPGA